MTSILLLLLWDEGIPLPHRLSVSRQRRPKWPVSAMALTGDVLDFWGQCCNIEKQFIKIEFELNKIKNFFLKF
jgi:hypothetical protein